MCRRFSNVEVWPLWPARIKIVLYAISSDVARWKGVKRNDPSRLMLGHFIRKEILDSLLNQRFIALAIFSITLMPFSGLINVEYYQARKAAFDGQKAEYDGRDHSPYDMRGYRGPALLSVLARGSEPFMPIYFSFSNDATATSPGNIEAQDFTTLSTFGGLDYLFIVQIVFSLLAILLAFDMVAGEKERGTLRAVLANRVPRDIILLGKLVGGYVVLWATFLIGTLLLFLILLMQDGRFLEYDVLLRVGFIFGIASLFLAGFFTLGLMVSTFCHSTRSAIVALLVTWVILQLVIPKAGEKIAAVLLPVESKESLRVARSQVVENLQREMRMKAGKLYMEIAGRSDIQGAFQFVRSGTPEASDFIERYRIIASEYDRMQRTQVRELDQAHKRQKERQLSLSRRIALLSPSSALTFLVTDAAGTGDFAYETYLESVDDQYRTIDAVVFALERSNRFAISNEGSTMMGDLDQSDSPPIDDVPEFEARSPSLTEVVNRNIGALISLALYLIVPFMISYLVFLRYDVR